MKVLTCCAATLFLLAPGASFALATGNSLLLRTEAGATVIWEGVEIGRADERGRLTIAGLPRGEFRISVHKEGFLPKQGIVTITTDHQSKSLALLPGRRLGESASGGEADAAAFEGSLAKDSAVPTPRAVAVPPSAPSAPTARDESAEVAEPDPNNLVARLGNFRKRLALTGQLRAQQSTIVNVPRNSSLWSFLVTELAPEGSVVQEGDLLVRFDSTELAQQILELEKQKEDARIGIAQKKAEQEAALQDLRLAVATAQKNLNTAELYLGIDRSLIPAADADRHQFDYDKAQVELEKSSERLAGHGAASAAELALNQLELDRAEIELERVKTELDRMTIRAPTPGLVIHGLTNEGRKIEVGDALFKGNQVVILPDMSHVMVRATAFDSDYALLNLGDDALITFDAYPNRAFSGSVLSLPDTAKPKDRNSDLNIFVIEILVHELDLSIMKPGMTARVEVPVDAPGALIVSRRSVGLNRDGTSFVIARRQPDSPIPIEVLDGNAFEFSIVGKVAPETQLLDQQPARSIPELSDVEWIPVERHDVKFSVSPTGILKAARSVSVMPPAIPDAWRFKIIRMSEEGARVQETDTIVAFDPSEQLRRLEEEEADLKKTEQELEKVRASQTLAERDLELELEEARVQLEKAENKLGQVQQFASGLQIQEAEQEAILARKRVELLGRKLESTREHSRLQLHILAETAQLHQGRISLARDAVKRLEVKALRSGVVVYKRNWNNQKKQVGSEAHLGETIMSLPDLESLIIEGQVAEVDSGRLEVGQVVEISLDAMPERTFSGRIATLGRLFVQPSRNRPIRVLTIEVHFDEVDATRMRPEMVARLSIVLDHYRDVLSVPLSVIELQGNRSFVWVQRDSEILRQEIEVGENNGIVAVVTQGLEPGDRVAAGGLNGLRQ